MFRKSPPPEVPIPVVESDKARSRRLERERKRQEVLVKRGQEEKDRLVAMLADAPTAEAAQIRAESAKIASSASSKVVTSALKDNLNAQGGSKRTSPSETVDGVDDNDKSHQEPKKKKGKTNKKGNTAESVPAKESDGGEVDAGTDGTAGGGLGGQKSTKERKKKQPPVESEMAKRAKKGDRCGITDPSDSLGCEHWGIQDFLNRGGIPPGDMRWHFRPGGFLVGNRCRGCNKAAEDLDKNDCNSVGKVYCYLCDEGLKPGGKCDCFFCYGCLKSRMDKLEEGAKGRGRSRRSAGRN